MGLDVKAMRSQKPETATRHLANSRRVFLALVDKVRSFDPSLYETARGERDYESLEMAILDHLMGIQD